MMRFDKGQEALPGYRVKFPIKDAANAETYRVLDEAGQAFFLKIFQPNRLNEDDFDLDGRLREIRILEGLDLSGVPATRKSGTIGEGEEAPYVLMEFVSGETLHERLRREHTLLPEDARSMMLALLDTVGQLHAPDDPLIHNAINPGNILLDLQEHARGQPKLIDFKHARTLREGPATHPVSANPYFQACECFEGIGNPRTDAFALGAVYYAMLFGAPPWEIGVSSYRAGRVDIREALAKRREQPLSIPHLAKKLVIPESAIETLCKALSTNPEERYIDAQAFRRAMLEESAPGIGKSGKATKQTWPRNPSRPAQRGFDAIAGMDALKRTLTDDVVNALRDCEIYEEYGLTIPNGLLLYGPPGCGKTFIAERLAEEIDLNFRIIRPSDIASVYIHGTQEKIRQLFESARKEAPSILFFDEIDAILPSREGNLQHSYAAEVNELLAQMNNCSESGVFIIGATNRPDRIDPAILRTGRMDKVVYVGPPDFDARKAMFQLHLAYRPVQAGLDIDDLAGATDDRVGSDLKFLVDQAARNALQTREKIGMSHLLEAIRTHPPSVSRDQLRQYESLRYRFEDERMNRSGRSTPSFHRNT